ncbi:MAG: hypothetical protein GY820_36450 [Gammaproteobacteria bacterium]|nr:hypothetical protein [Gammaproteobacteria bacterium]
MNGLKAKINTQTHNLGREIEKQITSEKGGNNKLKYPMAKTVDSGTVRIELNVPERIQQGNPDTNLGGVYTPMCSC